MSLAKVDALAKRVAGWGTAIGVVIALWTQLAPPADLVLGSIAVTIALIANYVAFSNHRFSADPIFPFLCGFATTACTFGAIMSFSISIASFLTTSLADSISEALSAGRSLDTDTLMIGMFRRALPTVIFALASALWTSAMIASLLRVLSVQFSTTKSDNT